MLYVTLKPDYGPLQTNWKFARMALSRNISKLNCKSIISARA